MKTAIQIVLVALILVFSYLIYESIQGPIRFKAEQRVRYNLGIERLKLIRTAQVFYKTENGKYTGSFDTLIHFIKEGKMKVVRMEIDPNDTIDFSRGIAKDTILVSIKDSLFRDINVDSLRYIPVTGGNIEMASSEIVTASKVLIPVFEAKIPNDIILEGLDPQLIINFNYEREQTVKYAGLQVGSIEEANNNTGNWE